MTSKEDSLKPEKELASRIALHSAIGQALEQALEDSRKDSAVDSPAELTPTATHSIQECFGRAVVTTDWKKQAKPAVLEGRMDHFNRFQGQWRIVVDSGAKLRGPRRPPSKKQKIAEEEEADEDVVKIDDPIQILVYNDL